MDINQKTISKEGSFSGVGLHSGKPAQVCLKPAAIDAGILFMKNGKRVEWFSAEPSAQIPQAPARCSRIGQGANQILTVEHLLSALTGLGICNILVEVAGDEIPALDGCAAGFVGLLKDLGISDQKKSAEVYGINEPIFVWHDHAALGIYPDDALSFHYVLDYPFPYLKRQLASFTFRSDDYQTQISSARTFCTETEASALLEMGYGAGADLKNTIVVRQDGSHQAGLRFANECARHKILDLIGDLTLCGFRFSGRVVGIRSGHALNRELVLRIRKQKGVI